MFRNFWGYSGVQVLSASCLFQLSARFGTHTHTSSQGVKLIVTQDMVSEDVHLDRHYIFTVIIIT